jgi:hypothetical protein
MKSLIKSTEGGGGGGGAVVVFVAPCGSLSAARAVVGITNVIAATRHRVVRITLTLFFMVFSFV